MTRVERLAVRLLAAALAIAFVFGLTSYGVYKIRLGDWWWFWQEMAIAEIAADQGRAFVGVTGRSDLGSRDGSVPALLLENGRGLFPPHAPLDDIRALGGGRFNFINNAVYFSTADGSDPRANARRYSLIFPPVARPTSRALYGTTLAVFILSLAVSAWCLRVLTRQRSFVTLVQVLHDQLTAAIENFAAGLRTAVHDRLGTRRVLAWLAALWLVLMLMIEASQGVFLMRTGQWTAFWQEAPLANVQPDTGFAYVARTGREDLGSHRWPSPASLFEDGVPMELRNSPHLDIRNAGAGRYSFWHDQLYFSASDNSDPRTNGRRYVMRYPPVTRTMARVVYVVSGLIVLITGLATTLAIGGGILGAFPRSLVGALQTHGAFLLGTAGAVGLLSIAILRAVPNSGPTVSLLWVPILALNVFAALALRVRYGGRAPAMVLGMYLAVLSLSFYFLTAWAPHRSQGCHTTDPYPVWDVFCVAPDSASYYSGYDVGSTRQPLYPWFIGALTRGTGFRAQTFIESIKPGQVLANPADPLFRVVRTQIFLLLAAAAIACAALMIMLGSPLPAVAFVALYDQQFFSANEFNMVLTEPLVQTCVMLLTASFLVFVYRKRPAPLMLAAMFSGLAYLTRQAALYSALMLGVMILMGLAENARRWWKWSAAAVIVFAGICVIPDGYTYWKTGDFARQQDSLQYQYRIAHALQYARPEDVDLMPDEESRAWLADAVVRRDAAHRAVEAKFAADEFNRMIYYIATNLYEVATPVTGPVGEPKTPQFFMKVATPILQRHWTEYLRFAFRFWQFGLTQPGLVRLDVFDFSPWYTYAGLWLLIVILRDGRALAAATMILCHWAAVAIICLAAVPIPRMVGASEFLVVLAAAVLFWDACERIADSAAWQSLTNRMQTDGKRRDA